MNDSKSLPRREANAADFNDISNKNEYQIWTDNNKSINNPILFIDVVNVCWALYGLLMNLPK